MKLLAWAALAAATLTAQTKQERGKQIIDQALAALGGDRYLAMKDRTEAGRAYSFYREELSGLSRATIYTRFLDVPNAAPGDLLVSERQSFGVEERYGAVLFAEGKGYEITFRGARPLAEERIERYRDSTLHNVFYILRQRLKEPGMIFEFQNTDILVNQPAEIVDITDGDNRTVTVYFHRSTHLPLRQSYVWRDPKTKQRNEEVTIFSKYRDIGGGVQWPYDVERLRNGDRLFQLYADEVTINQDLPDKLFALPTGIRMLKPVR